MMAPELLRPQHFVTRENGTMVPVIAMDELPATVNIRGVSRSLSQFDIAGMTSIGVVTARHRQYVVDGPNGFPIDCKGWDFNSKWKSTTASTQDKTLMASAFAGTGSQGDVATEPSTADRPKIPTQQLYPAPPKAFGIEEQAPGLIASPFKQPPAPVPTRIDRNAGPQSVSSLPPWHNPAELPLRAAPGVKQYCSYWLRHGECDYAQQGCLYRHEMPLEKSTLQKLGLRDIPRWYREKHGLGSYLATASMSPEITAADSEKKEAMTKPWQRFAGGVGNERGVSRSRGVTAKQTNENTKTSSTSVGQVNKKPAEQIVAKTSTGLQFPPLNQPPLTTMIAPRRHLAVLQQPPASPSSTRIQFPAPSKPQAALPSQKITDCIATLDAHKNREKGRDLLAEKYPILRASKSFATTAEVSTSVEADKFYTSGASFSNGSPAPTNMSSSTPSPESGSSDASPQSNQVKDQGDTSDSVEIESILRSAADDDLEGSTAGLKASKYAQQTLLGHKNGGKKFVAVRGYGKEGRKGPPRGRQARTHHHKGGA